MWAVQRILIPDISQGVNFWYPQYVAWNYFFNKFSFFGKDATVVQRNN